jgi:hypothetical protein
MLYSFKKCKMWKRMRKIVRVLLLIWIVDSNKLRIGVWVAVRKWMPAEEQEVVSLNCLYPITTFGVGTRTDQMLSLFVDVAATVGHNPMGRKRDTSRESWVSKVLVYGMKGRDSFLCHLFWTSSGADGFPSHGSAYPMFVPPEEKVGKYNLPLTSSWSRG